MKKSLLALAVLGAFAGAVSAQSSVTIYGSIDQGIAKSNGGTSGNNGGQAGGGGGAGAGLANAAQRRAYTLQSANQNRLGFRGNEDLGGGMSAQFQIEHRFNADTGTQADGAVFWQGRSYVQLSHEGAGRVYLGRDYGPAFWLAVKSDPFGFDGVGQLGAMMYGTFRDPSPTQAAGQVRTANTIGYKSPSFGGLTIQAATSLGEAVVGRTDGLNLEYGAGPIYAAFAFERVKGGPTGAFAGSRDGDRLMSLAFHYDLGFVKPMLYFSRSQIDTANTPVGVGDVDTDFLSIGALAPIGPGRLKAVFARLKPDAGASLLPSTTSLLRTRKVGLGYDYPLSKRTNLYADLGVTKTDTFTRNTTWSFGAKHTF